jgi:RTX calcium-binding nonapeptide repeat (4 copies)
VPGAWPPSLLGALAVVLVLVAPSPALAASTVTTSVFGVEYDGDDGVNFVVVTDEAAPAPFMTRVRLAETGIVAMAGCTQDGTNAAYCDIDNSDDVDMDLRGGNDVAMSNGTRVRYRMSGRAGDDTLTGSDAERGASFFAIFDNLNGDEGKDTVFGRGGDDNLDGGDGDGDVVEGGEGDDGFSFYESLGSGDVLRGGPGFDKLFTFFFGPDPAPGATVDLAAGTAQFPGLPVLQFEGMEDADGDEGPDTLLGNDAINDLEGEESSDFIDGRGGPDFLDGQEDDDHLEGRDGFQDTLDGGFGTDTCDADQLDTREDCEGGALIQVPPFGTPVADRTGPACAATGVPSRVRARRLRRRGLAFGAQCDEAGRLSVRLLVVLRRPGRRAQLSRAGDVELAARSMTVAANVPVRLRLRVGRRLRPLLVRGVRLRLELAATDAAGNERILSRAVRLR